VGSGSIDVPGLRTPALRLRSELVTFSKVDDFFASKLLVSILQFARKRKSHKLSGQTQAASRQVDVLDVPGLVDITPEMYLKVVIFLYCKLIDAAISFCLFFSLVVWVYA
jgi:hypothetical protein